MKALLISAVLAGGLNAAAFAVDGNTIAAITTLLATVITTLSVVKWVDKRIEHKVRNYANTVRWQHRTILLEISALRELMGHSPLNVDLILYEEKNGKKEVA